MEELKSYIISVRQQGQTDQQIKQTLITAGWNPEIVDNALKALPASNKPSKKLHRRKKLFIPLLIVTILICLFGVFRIAYSNRGWIRGSAIPAYVNFFYKRGVEKDFTADFNPINERLQTYGTGFKTIQNGCWKGGDALFEGISETVPCIRQQESSLQLSSAFIGRWKAESPAFERYLLSTGWKKQYDEKQPINTLFNNPVSNTGLSVNYAKVHDKAYCNFSIAFTPYVTMDQPTILRQQGTISEMCARDVSFFAGSQG